jgi:UDP-3-O-[3-hydroxymyristoyl] N-acetylglucosamine deacetylase
MQEIYQKSLLQPVSFKGIGLHSGKNSTVTIFPGEEDRGIVFKRVDVKQNNIIEANYQNVSSAKLCTTLENKYGVKVSTVEHLLAALYIVGIDNAIIEIDNEEVPIMDGSAKDFLDILSKTEIKLLTKKRKYLKILNKVEFLDGERKISIEPSNSTFEVDFQLNYENKIIGKQRNSVSFQTDDLNDIYNSRTFCLYEDIEKIKKIGLAKGGSLENAVVVDQEKVLNDGGLRNEKEFVNHKILDLAGDFLLSGYRILGKVKCYQGGHELTNKFLRKLLNCKSAILSMELNDIIISKKESSDQPVKIAINA